jgi:hypothetical protein
MNPFIVTQLVGEHRRDLARRADGRPGSALVPDDPAEAWTARASDMGRRQTQAAEGLWLVDPDHPHRWRGLVAGFGDLLVKAGTRLGGEAQSLSVQR